MCSQVHALLASSGLSVSLLHGDLPQMLRDEAMTCFKFGVTSIMVRALSCGYVGPTF